MTGGEDSPMASSRSAARDALLARGRWWSASLVVASLAGTGAVAGWLARPVTAEQPADSLVAPRQVRVEVRLVPAPATAGTASEARRPVVRRPARQAPVRPPVAPPRTTQQAPATTSSGS